jgi:hypothetical protein
MKEELPTPQQAQAKGRARCECVSSRGTFGMLAVWPTAPSKHAFCANTAYADATRGHRSLKVHKPACSRRPLRATKESA